MAIEINNLTIDDLERIIKEYIKAEFSITMYQINCTIGRVN